MKDSTTRDMQTIENPAQGAGFNLAPRTLDEAMQFSKLMADSELVPKDFRGKAGNVLIAVQMGAEIGIPPMQAIQNIAVINGRPGIWGDLGKAVLLSRGCKIEERDVKDIKTTGEAHCRITRPDGRVTERTYTVEDAKTAGLWARQGPWTTNPHRQLAWRAFWFAARDAAADMLKGLYGAELLADLDPEKVVETTAVPEPKRKSAAPAAPAPAPAADPTPAPAGVIHEPVGTHQSIGIAEAKQFFTLAKQAGKTESEIKAYLTDVLGIERSMDMQLGDWPAACAWARSGPGAAVDKETGEVSV